MQTTRQSESPDPGTREHIAEGNPRSAPRRAISNLSRFRQVSNHEYLALLANEKHADPESVFGSIADAHFENDKHVAGSFTFERGFRRS